VLDGHAEARAVERLFVADNSALANGLGGPNPTLTTQALATRTAETIFRKYFDGDPWIAREAPVSSAGATVTRAVVERGLTPGSYCWPPGFAVITAPGATPSIEYTNDVNIISSQV
jgi:choline dehydrogenase-like flavoprotein